MWWQNCEGWRNEKNLKRRIALGDESEGGGVEEWSKRSGTTKDRQINLEKVYSDRNEVGWREDDDYDNCSNGNNGNSGNDDDIGIWDGGGMGAGGKKISKHEPSLREVFRADRDLGKMG